MNRDESIVSDLSCWATMVVFIVGLVALAVNLKEVQIDAAPDYNYEKARQSVRRVQTAGPRGRILDRRGRVLADNRRCVSIVCNAAHFKKKTWDETTRAIIDEIDEIGEILGRSSHGAMSPMRSWRNSPRETDCIPASPWSKARRGIIRSALLRHI